MVVHLKGGFFGGNIIRTIPQKSSFTCKEIHPFKFHCIWIKKFFQAKNLVTVFVFTTSPSSELGMLARFGLQPKRKLHQNCLVGLVGALGSFASTHDIDLQPFYNWSL